MQLGLAHSLGTLSSVRLKTSIEPVYQVGDCIIITSERLGRVSLDQTATNDFLVGQMYHVTYVGSGTFRVEADGDSYVFNKYASAPWWQIKDCPQGDANFNYANFDNTFYAHEIIFLQNFNYVNGYNRDYNKIYSAGEIWQTIGSSGDGSLIRAEDPQNPRNKPLRTDNQGTGAWAWLNISDRGTLWEFVNTDSNTSTPTNPQGFTWTTTSVGPNGETLSGEWLLGDSPAIGSVGYSHSWSAWGAILLDPVTNKWGYYDMYGNGLSDPPSILLTDSDDVTALTAARLSLGDSISNLT